MRNILLYTIIVGLVFSGGVFLAKQEVAIPDFGLSVFLPTQGGTGTSTVPSLNQILQGDGTGVYTLTTEPTFDSVSAGTLIVSTAVTGDLAMAGNDITNAGSITGTHFIATSTTQDSNFHNNTLVIDSSAGNVGIGDTTPADVLEVYSASDANLYIRRGSTSANDFAELSFGVSTGDLYHASIRGIRTGAGATGDIAFLTQETAGAAYGTLDEKVRITSAGNVGIGTTTPQGILDIQADANSRVVFEDSGTNRIQLRFDDENNSAIHADFEAYQYNFQDGNGSDVVTINPDGYLGIGTTNPGTKLSLNVGGDFNAQTWERTAGGYFTSLGYAGGRPYFTYYAPDYFTIGYGTVTHQAPTVNTLVLKNDGNVGIGTTAPDSPLEISATPSGTNPLLKLTRASSGQEWGLSPDNNYFNIFDYTNSPTTARLVIDTSGNLGINKSNPSYALDVNGTINIATASGLRWGSGDAQISHSGYNMIFSLWSGSALTERMRLTQAGNLGIGVASPTRKLVVYDTDANTPTISIKTDSSGTGTGDGLDIQFASNNAFLFNRESGYMAFGTANTERMRIDSSGNVGIGTTTPNFASWGRALSIQSTTGAAVELISTKPDADATQLGGYAMKYFTNNAGHESIAQMDFYTDGSTVGQRGGQIRFRTKANGSTTLVDRMIVTNQGNVGIGTTSPVYKLSVENSSEGNTLQLYDTDGNCLLDPDSGSLVTTCSSDARLKTNIRDAGSAIGYLNKLRIKDYTVIASGVEATGVIAQEVQKTHPELVQELGDGFLGVTEISSWKLVKAIQELYSTIVKIVAVLKTHESRLDRLEAENEALKVRLEALEAKYE